MKKFLEKHDLFKIIGLIIVFVVLLTWIIPSGSYTNGQFVLGKITRNLSIDR